MKYLSLLLLTLALNNPIYADTQGNYHTGKCLDLFIDNTPSKEELAKNEDCIKSSLYMLKQERELLEAAKILGVLNNPNIIKTKIKRKQLYSPKKIRELTEIYLVKELNIKLSKFKKPRVSFNFNRLTWNLFYICDQKGPVYIVGCHFSVTADNEKNPGFRFNPGK